MAGKRKAAAARGDAPRKEEEGEAFPRGGKSALSEAEIREARAEAEAEFAYENEKQAKKKKRGQSSVNDDDLISLSGNTPKSVELLRFKKISTGMRILGAVSEINTTDISVSLTNGLHGFVKPEEAFPDDIIQDFKGDDKQRKEHIHELLQDLFQIGMLVACTVLNVEETRTEDGKKQSKRAILSFLPKHFNEGLTIDSVYIGQLMVASVKSIEDHGYILSFGVSGVSGFLLHKDLPDGSKLREGQIIQGFVSAIDKKRKVVNLSLDKLQTLSNVKEHDSVSLGTLVPGAVIKARVQSILKNGLMLSFLTYFTGMVDLFHLESDFPGEDWAQDYTEGKQVKARILFIDPRSKVIRLSLRTHLLQSNLLLPSVDVGDTFENATIKRIDSHLGLLLELPGSTPLPGYVNFTDASDEPIEKLQKKFNEGQTVRARVIGYRLMDGLASLSLKESVLKGVVNKLNLKAGMLVYGVVTKLETFGAFVDIGRGVRALCPLQHMSEYSRLKPSGKFKIGARFKFRILQYDLQMKRLTVTHKKTLVSSKLPQITSYEDGVQGLIAHGWIQGIEPIGCFVEFYNYVKGLVHRSELGLDANTPVESAFQVGQVVKCRVLRAQPLTKRLALSFVLNPSTEGSNNEFKLGSIVSAEIIEIGELSMTLRVSSSKSNVNATMSYLHLSDTPVHVEQMRCFLKSGYKFDRLLVLDNYGPMLTLTAKPSLLQAADSLPSSINQLSPQQVLPGYISEMLDNVCFVSFLGNLKGLVSIRNASDTFTEDLSKIFYVGQSVRAQVLEVDLENGKFSLSLKQSACFSTDVSLIEGYFLEEELIAELKAQDQEAANLEWTKSLTIGDVVDADVQEIKDYGIILNLKDHADVVGFATHYQSDGGVEAGTSVKARILDIVKVEGIVDLSLSGRMLQSSSNKKTKKALKLHEKVQAVVELVKDEYLVLSLPDFGNAIAYASTRDYNTRTLRPHDYYVPGQRFFATIYNTGSVTERILVLLAGAINSQPAKTISKTHSKYDIGSIVEAEILEIHPLHMIVKVGDGLRGKVHVTEVNDEYVEGHPFGKYGIGQKVQGRIYFKSKASKASKNAVTLDLSLRASETGGGGLRSVITFETVNAGQEVIGYVQDVTDDWAWLLLAPHTRGRLFVLDSSDTLSELENFKERFKVGHAVKCHIARVDHGKKILDLSMRNMQHDKISKGELVPGRIAKVHPGIKGLSVQIGVKAFGKVHVTHLGDLWMSNPAELFKAGKFVKCRVLEVKTASKGEYVYELSLRPSLGGSGGFESLVTTRDVRGRTVNTIEELKPDMEVQGFVKHVTERGCFLTLAPHIDAKILLKNLSDTYVVNPRESFPVGKLVTGRVLSVEPLSGRVEMTLASITPFEEKKGLKDFHVGDIVAGSVRKIEKFGIFITLAESDIVGLCHVSEISDDFIENISGLYKVGQRVYVKILKVDEENKRISLGLKASYLQTEFRNPTEDEEEEDTEPDIPSNMEVDDEDTIESDDAEGMEIDDVDPDRQMSNARVEPLQVDLEEEEDEGPVEVEKPAVQVTKKLSKKEKKRLKEEKEAAIRAAEERLLHNDLPPETEDDFERLVRQSPNSSFLWIKYMAFWLRLADADKARATAERALETINYREENEKLNIWTAYLNLENAYGSNPKEAVAALFERALKFCDPKKIHLALLGIYEKSDTQEMTDALMKTMLRKFKTSTKIWLRHIANLLQRGLADKARKAFDRALQVLPRHKHIKFISRAAVAEFKSGSPERAREIFDGVLRNYPKRTDLWSVYLDQEIKLGDITVIRELLERATCLDLPAKKMKFLFKKYLEFEKSQGDESRIEYVKNKAMDFVAKTS